MTIYFEKIAGVITLALAFRQRSAWATWGDLVSTKEKDCRKGRKEGKRERKEEKAKGYSWESWKNAYCRAVLTSPLLMCTWTRGLIRPMSASLLRIHLPYLLQPSCSSSSLRVARQRLWTSLSFQNILTKLCEMTHNGSPNWSTSIATNWWMTKSNSQTMEYV